MSVPVSTIITHLTSGTNYTSQQMKAAFHAIMSGDVSPTLISAFLIALKMRGETPDDIAAGASTLREMADKITAPDGAVDIVGTGGDGIGTYNISTATAFVVAGAGVCVAKHGNRAVSSKSGAADVLTSLGVNLDAPFPVLEQALAEAGVCFLMAPRHHSAMRHVGPIRAELGTRTIFNLLGPLSNPALVSRVMVGVYDKAWCRPFAEALASLGTTNAWVVHGLDGLDEVTTTTKTYVAALSDGKITEFEIAPADYGISEARLDDLKGGTGPENAVALRALLSNNNMANDDVANKAYRDIVLMNAAASLVGTGHETDFAAALERAKTSLDTGAALTALDKLVAITNQKA
ncbi:MAG: anthranilate phosphoribosyltransferase [Candidatus Puniceispirillaceae bacterium]